MTARPPRRRAEELDAPEPEDVNDPAWAVADVIARRLSTTIELISARDVSHAKKQLNRWNVEVDLTAVPREIIERTSDHVRRATVYLTIPPIEPEIAIGAVEDAVALWRPAGHPPGNAA
jgi:hypothetical protein